MQKIKLLSEHTKLEKFITWRDEKSTKTAAIIDDEIELFKCATDGNLDALQTLAKNDSLQLIINHTDYNGTTALHHAVKHCHDNMVLHLVENYHADVNIQDNEGLTPLHIIAGHHDNEKVKETLAVVECLIRNGANINKGDKANQTPLHSACIRGNIAVAQALVNNKEIDVNSRDLHGQTALHHAILHDQDNIATLLLRNGSEALASDNDLVTPLHITAMRGHNVIMDILFQYIDDKVLQTYINSRDVNGCTSLHCAVTSGNLSVVAKLIDKGADINAICYPDTTAHTVLHLAVLGGIQDVLQLLLEKGANVNATDKHGANILHFAVQLNSIKFIQLILQQPNVDVNSFSSDLLTPIMVAAIAGNVQIVQMLLDKKPDITLSDNARRNVIYFAAKHGNLQLMEALINYMSLSDQLHLIHSRDIQRNTPCHVAAQLGHLLIVRLLVKNGAEIHVKNKEGKSVFHVAAEHGQERVVEDILTSGVKYLHDEDQNSQTALHLAVKKGHIDVVKLLIQRGTNKHARNNKQRTALHVAALHGHVDVLRYLLDERFLIDVTDRELMTPLHLATLQNDVDIVQLLLNRGANVALVNREGYNALNIAVDKGFINVGAVILRSARWRSAMINNLRPISLMQQLPSSANSKNIVESISDSANFAKLSLQLLFSQKKHDTTLRQMINKTPELALQVFDNCVSTGPDTSTKHTDPKFFIEYNMEFIDDTFSCWNGDSHQENEEYQNTLYTKKGKVNSKAEPYSNNTIFLHDNHPLIHMIVRNRENLLRHHLVAELIKRKWRLTRTFYITSMIIYMVYLFCLSTFILSSKPPYEINYTSCSDESIIMANIPGGDFCQHIIWLLSVVGIFVEVIQILTSGFKYFESLANIMDWFCYISAIYVSVDLTPCRARTHEQYQLSAFTIIVAWLNLLTYFRRMPFLGIYVLMIEEILKTFAKFFALFFFFILAFAFGFYILLQNQIPFAGVGITIVKTTVMMIGEMTFNEIFHMAANKELDNQVYFETSSYIVFTLFVMLMTVLVMNLLTGLAVDDVSGLQANAKLKKLALQVNLALEVELSMPMFILRRLVYGKMRVYPNNNITRTGFWSWLLRLAPIVADEFEETTKQTNAVNNDLEERISRVLHQSKIDNKKLTQDIEALSNKITLLIDNVTKLTEKMNRQ